MEKEKGDAVAEPVPVLLVDDHAIWREGLRSLLRGTESRVEGEASSGPEALEAARTAPACGVAGHPDGRGGRSGGAGGAQA